MAETVETAIYRLRIEGQDQLDRLTESIEGLAVAEEDATKATRTTSEELQRRIARYDPLIRAQQAYTKELENIARYQESGVGTQQEINALFEGATSRYNAAKNATAGLADAHKGLNAQGQAAFHSLRSVFEQVALGIPITQALTGQMNHLTFAASAEGGLAGAFKQAGGMIGEMAKGALEFVNPMNLAIGAVVAFGVAAVTTAAQWLNAQKAIQQSLLGIGAQSGATAEGLRKFSEGGGLTGLSTAQRGTIATEFTKTGGIDVSQLKGVTEAVHGYAIITGTDATEATKKLAQALGGDLAKGIQDLTKVYGALNPALKETVQIYERLGERAKAQQAIIDAMAAANQRAIETTSFAGKAWEVFGNAISKATDAMGAFIVKRALFGAFAPGPPKGDQEQINALAQSNLTQAKGQAVIADLNPENAQLNKLKQQLEDLRRAKIAAVGETGPIKLIDDGTEQKLQNAIELIEKLKDLYPGISSEVAKQLETNKNNLPVIEAIGGAAKRAAQYEADRLNAILQNKSATEAAKIAQDNLNKSIAETNAASRERVWQNENQMKSTEAVGGAAKIIAQEEETINRLLHEGVGLEQARVEAASERAKKEAELVAASKEKVWQMQNELDSIIKVGAAGQEQLATGEKITLQQKRINELKHDGLNADQAAVQQQMELNLEIAKRVQKADQEIEMLKATTHLQEMKIQYERTYNEMISKGASAEQAKLVAEKEFQVEVEKANKQVTEQIKSLDQQNKEILRSIDGVDASVIATEAYNRALENGADLLHAQALYWATIKNEIIRAEAEIDKANIASQKAKTAADLAYATQYGTFAASVMTQNNAALTFEGGAQASYRGGGTGKILSLPIGMADVWSAQKSSAQLEVEAAGRTWGEPAKALTDSVDKLKDSTDKLNATNEELLSPFYTQDPRTSHIGFRSQGMAAGGYVDVPGLPSANDNLIAQIPVASGERIYVDPMSVKRGNAGTVINISAPMMFSGQVNRDEVGRTVYQNMQIASRSIAAAQR